MGRELTLRIVLENPPTGVDFGLQKGRGSDYETIQSQRSKGERSTLRVHGWSQGRPQGSIAHAFGSLCAGPTGCAIRVPRHRHVCRPKGYLLESQVESSAEWHYLGPARAIE